MRERCTAMASPAPTQKPTRDDLEAALALVLTYSVNRTEAAAHLGRSYMALARDTLTPSFEVGREQRYWLIDLDEWARR
jgi:hypothetical protein